MSVPDRRKRRRKSEHSSLQILEEAFHLLRTVDLKYYWWLYAGLVPFAVALLYFTADQSRSSLAAQSILSASLMMALLYFWMRWCQSKFCEGLWETLSPGAREEKSPTEKMRSISAMLLIQAFHFPLLLVGSFFAIPLGWVLAAQQNFTILAATQNYHDRPLRSLFFNGMKHSHYDWAQNHGILLVMFVVSLFTWLNIVATCLMVPGFAKSFFGVESIFTISPAAAIMNTSFILGSLLLTWLVVSPMMKAAYTLRCFYCESRHTGADLLSRLAASSRARERSVGSPVDSSISRTALIALCFFSLSSLPVMSEDVSPGVATGRPVSGEQFQESMSATLEQKKYQWQLSRRSLEGEDPMQENWLTRRINEIAETTRDAFKKFADWLEEVFEKLTKDRKPASRKGTDIDPGFFNTIGSTLSIGLILLVSALAAWLVLILYRKYRGRDTVEADEVFDAGSIDLQSEEIVASQLPEDEWMRLAREQIEKGDTRLAVRALFLATLAKLGEEDLLRIAKFKSNRDYRIELERKARKSEGLRSSFEANTKLFERAWYGWHPVSEEAVESFLRNHERIAVEAKKLAGSYSGEPYAAEAH
jgi:hypothetical protein